MRILVLSWRDPKHPLAGGAEQVMHEHMKGWIVAGHSVTLFTSHFSGARSHEEIDRISIIRKGNQILGVHIIAFSWYLFAKHPKYDVVVDQFHFAPFFTPLYTRKPVIAVIQEVAKELWFRQALPKPFSWIIGLLGYLFEPLFFLFYKKVPFITGSETAKKDVIAMGINKDRITVIPHGVIIKNPKPMPPKEKKPTVIFLGAITRDKGIVDALEALRRLGKAGNYRFWVAGKADEEYTRLMRAAENEFGNTLKYWGFVSQEQKFSLLARAHILINPSVREGWGLVNIEANAVGTPVVAYNSPGLIDSVRDNVTGIICGENTPESMAENIEKIIKDKQLFRELSKGAVAWSKQFNWSESRKKSLKLIERVAAGENQ